MGIQKDKLTEEQKKEIEFLRNFVSRNRLNPQMNGTKWRAAIGVIQALAGYIPSFRVKRITDHDDPPVDQWDEAFPGNIPLYNSIEWLELNRKVVMLDSPQGKPRSADFGESLRTVLTAAHIPLGESKTGIRIIGFSRSGPRA